MVDRRSTSEDNFFVLLMAGAPCYFNMDLSDESGFRWILRCRCSLLVPLDH